MSVLSIVQDMSCNKLEIWHYLAAPLLPLMTQAGPHGLLDTVSTANDHLPCLP